MELLREINSNQSVRLVSGDQSIFVFLWGGWRWILKPRMFHKNSSAQMW
jgi:hypothetical protein